MSPEKDTPPKDEGAESETDLGMADTMRWIPIARRVDEPAAETMRYGSGG